MSTLIKKYLVKLRQAQVEHAVKALENPNQANASYSYGRVCGVHSGLKLAESLLEEVLKDSEKEI